MPSSAHLALLNQRKIYVLKKYGWQDYNHKRKKAKGKSDPFKKSLTKRKPLQHETLHNTYKTKSKKQKFTIRGNQSIRHQS